ncbi:uncharacterized protein ACWYII_001645 isoform 3-T6 [Salvelinus alpinus]
MEDTTAIVTTDHCAPVTKAAKQQAPGDEEDEEAGGWDIGTESWNTQSAASAVMKLPVLTQPGLGVTTTTVTTITQTGGDWSSSLFNVCGERSTCLLGAFVPCCLDLSLAHQYGECLCLPLLPGSTFAMRVGIRERYKIQGSVCEDWTTVYCCYPLAICQMIREMKRRMKSQTYKSSVLDFGKIIIYTSNLRIIRAPRREEGTGRHPQTPGGVDENSQGRNRGGKRRPNALCAHGEEQSTHPQDGEEQSTHRQDGQDAVSDCQHCGGSGSAPCSLCHGSKLSMLANRFNESISVLRCQACYPDGLERCQSCSK